MINRYIITAALAIAVVVLLYIYNFYYILNYSISNNTESWSQLGDYIGGLLGPILSFISLVLLIKSLTLQNEANIALKKELRNNEKNGKLKTFETQFFNMLDSQKISFDSFRIKFSQNGNIKSKCGVEAVIKIEDVIENLSGQTNSDQKILEFLAEIDSNDQLFGVTRRFYIMVKTISEKLSDENGFSANERNSHLMTLINFTDFPLLRLVMISMQFMNYKSTEYLKENVEFNSVLKEVGISWDLY